MSAILYSVRDFEVAKILLVTDSGAGAPFVRLYLIPKSLVGPTDDQQLTVSGSCLPNVSYLLDYDWR